MPTFSRTAATLTCLSILNLAAPRAAAQDDGATHDALRALKSGVEAAFNEVASGQSEDCETVLSFVTDEVVLTAMNGQCVVGKQGLREYFARTMTGPDRTVESIHHVFEPEALSILYGGDTAVGYGTSVGRYELTKGLSFDVNVRWTCTMVLQGGKWLIASFQFAPSIFDNPLLSRSLRMLYVVGGGAGVLGVLLGFLLHRFTGRKA